jgi:hypothetical protein
MTSDPIWFVSYRPNEISRTASHQRLTETFLSELEAKIFAKARFADSTNVTAGTLNPHLPKRVIGSGQIVAWFDKV